MLSYLFETKAGERFLFPYDEGHYGKYLKQFDRSSCPVTIKLVKFSLDFTPRRVKMISC